MSGRQTIPLKPASPRPAVPGGTKSSKNNAPAPRIPLELCDGPTQRLYALSTFILLQALKLWYWLGITRGDYASEFFGFVLWLSLDVLFLVVINYLRIPWFELPFLRLVLAFFTLTIINFVLFTAREISPTAIAKSSAYKVWGYIRSPVSSWAVEPDADDHEHLLGKYTLLLKPYSSAEFNREGRCYCIPRNSGFLMDKPEIPLIFNGSEPYSLSYSFTSFNTGVTTVRNLTGPFGDSSKEFRKTRSNLDDGIVFALQAKEPGAYRIERALDAERGEIRVSKNEAYVVTCPEAHLPGYKEPTDMCTSKGDADIPITVWGLPPWRVTYQRRSLGAKQETQELVIESEPPGYTSPFLPGWFEGDASNYTWAKPRELDLTASLGLGIPGEYHFAVSEVRDGCGNKVNYQALRAQDKIETEVKKVHVHSRPTVSATCDPRKPIKIVDLHESSAKIGLNVRHGEAPYTIRYTHQKDDLDKPVFQNDVVLKNLDDPHLTVRKSGLYNIISIADKYCNGTVELPSDCEVAVASKPTVDISATAIEDQCAGAIGLTVVATFTGEGPWTLCYDIYRNDNFMQNVCKNSAKPRLTLELKPEFAGLYRYDFKTVSDHNYGNIAVTVDPVLQMIHPQPNAEFAAIRGGNRACRGGQKEIKIHAYGEGPWDLQYQILHRGQAKVVTLENFNESLVDVMLPPFEHEGTYSVDLVSITDRANGCTKSLNVKDLVIDVAPNPPTAAFECPDVIEIPEGGEKDLLIHLTGGSPWFIRFGLKGENATHLHRAETRNALVTVNKPGEYQLRSVEDAFCEGVVVPPADVCKVVYSKKPSMQLAIDSIQFKGGPAHEKIVAKDDLFIMPSVCQDSVRTLELLLNGKAPFELKYELVYKPTKGSIERIVRTGRTEHSTLRLSVESNRPGTYSYRLLKLSDSLYPDVDIRNKDKAVVFEHLIRPLPTASIIKNKKQSFCKDEPRDDQEKIAIKIEDGIGPYELTIEVEGPGRSKDVIQVPNVVPVKGIYQWTPPTQFTNVGTYKVSVVRVADVNGCHQTNHRALEHASIEFEIVDTPRINLISADKCVGGQVKYSLEGQKPFQIQYSLDGSVRKETVQSNSFVYHATKAGNVTIQQVCHHVGSQQQKMCCSRPVGMTSRIWDLPSAKIADGHSVVRNLRDGERAEIVVTLEGEPPFTFEYVRKTPEYDSAKRWLGYKEIKETVRVDNVQERQHFIHTAIEGTFELLYIKDNHCSYRKRSRV